MTDPAEQDPMCASETAAFPTRHCCTASMHRLRYVRPSVPQTKSFSVGHLVEDTKLINHVSTATSISVLPVATFGALRAFASICIFLDRVDVSFCARFLLHFTGTHVDDAVGATYGLFLYARWWT
jgi:hypothetical protein